MAVNWDELQDAYGSAGAVPRLLELLEPDPAADVWDELYSRICHQGSVYSASYAALPYLLAVAQRWSPQERSAPLSLAGAIVSAPDSDRKQLDEHESTIEALRAVATSTLKTADLVREDTVYVAEAALAFQGDRLWGQRLDGLLSGELQGACPACDVDLFLVVGEDGFFTAAEEWINRPSTPRVPIEAVMVEDLEATGEWLLEVAAGQEDAELATWFRHMLGTTSCPICSCHFRVAEAVQEAF